MRARESGLWNWLSQGTMHLTDLHMHRIENSLSAGTPDVEGCVAGVGFDIELKSVSRPPGGNVWCELKSAQALFLRARWHVGGSSWVLVQVGYAHGAKRYLVRGCDSAELLQPVPETQLEELNCLRGTFTAVDVIVKVSSR